MFAVIKSGQKKKVDSRFRGNDKEEQIGSPA